MACLKVLCKLECAIMFIEFDSYKISREQHGVYHPLRGFTMEIIMWWYVPVSYHHKNDCTRTLRERFGYHLQVSAKNSL